MEDRAASAPAEARYPDPVFQAFAVKAASAHARDRVIRPVKDVRHTFATWLEDAGIPAG
jgi:integrase